MSDTYSNEPDDTDYSQNDLFDVDQPTGKKKKKAEEDSGPLYRIYKGSKIPVSRAIGTMWKSRFDAGLASYEAIFGAWNEVFKYYNNSQGKEAETPRGVFRRGDSTENVVYANLNTILPAIYSKDPDIAVNTIDEDDADLVSVMKSLLNVLLKGKDKLNAKPKIKRAAGLAILTNFGILKLDYVKKDDSREMAQRTLQSLLGELVKCKDKMQAETVHGKIVMLENTMELYDPSGPTMKTVLPHNLIIDPNAEADDGTDAAWMIERLFIKTDELNAKFTMPDHESEDGRDRVLVYKPTHKAAFKSSEGKRDDGLGMVMTAIAQDVVDNEDQERAKYRSQYYTECYAVWDKTTRRCYLFTRDDWVWPVWVWDDPLNITRFFPYFIICYNMSTGGTVTVGEPSYYLDQQDEINQINRQVAKMRRSVFNNFLYNSDVMNRDEAEKFIKVVRGDGNDNEPHFLGIRAGEGKKASEFIESFHPPAMEKGLEGLFNKEAILKTIDRLSSTSDAIRGAEFKTNTNTASVQSYQDAARMSVGAKVDVIEDVVSALATSLAELCIQNMSTEDVSKIVGKKQGEKWQQMPLEEFRANFSMECVAGTTEKQNSVFKKKEAVQVAQALGQFVNAAPVTVTKLMLRVLESAFSEIVIHPDDWAQLQQEAVTQAQKGISTGQQPNGGAAPAPGGGSPAGQPPGGGGDNDAMKQALLSLPPQVKAQAVQMKQGGAPDEQVKAFLMRALQAQQKQGGGDVAPALGKPPASQPNAAAAAA